METISNTPNPVTPQTSSENTPVTTNSVSGNISVPPSTQQQPPRQKIVKGKKPGLGFYLGCIGFFAILFVVFVVVSIVAIQLNPQSSFLGMSATEFKGILAGLVNVSFGMLSLILLIGLVTTVFKRVITKKEEKEAIKKMTIRSIILTIILMIDIIVWVAVFSSINQLQANKDGSLSAVIMAYDTTKPETKKILEKTTGLTAPIVLTLDASRITKKVLEQGGMTIQSYEWDLDGDERFNDKTGEVVTWNYMDKGKNNGRFDVNMRLTVRDNKNQIKTQDFPIYITIDNVAPTVMLSVDKEQGEAPLTIQFDASKSIDPDGQTPNDVSFAWDIDNNNAFQNGNDALLTYTFDKVGDYIVKVRVTDKENNFSIQERKITVTGIRQDTPIVKIQAYPLTGDAPLRVSFTGEESTSPNGKIIKYAWDFGDGMMPEKSMSISRQFSKPGTYKISLTITDEKGKEATEYSTITVTGKMVAPDIVLQTTPMWQIKNTKKIIEGTVPLSVTFDASKSTSSNSTIKDFTWDLDGDGVFETSGSKPSTFVYQKEGDYEAYIKIKDTNDIESTETISIKVSNKPIEAVIKATPLSGSAPLTVQFDASASRYNNGQIQSYIWDFNDGTSPKIYAAQLEYTFPRVGIYHVKLTVLTNDGKKETTTQDIVVTEVPLIARFVPNVKKGNAPLTVLFDPSPSTGAITRYEWNFGDGMMSTDRKPTHTFTKKGEYLVILKISSKDNITNSYTEKIIVE